MLAIDDFEVSILTDKIRQGTDGNADVTTDGHGSYASLGKDGRPSTMPCYRRQKEHRETLAVGVHFHQQRQEKIIGHLTTT